MNKYIKNKTLQINGYSINPDVFGETVIKYRAKVFKIKLGVFLKEIKACLKRHLKKILAIKILVISLIGFYLINRPEKTLEFKIIKIKKVEAKTIINGQLPVEDKEIRAVAGQSQMQAQPKSDIEKIIIDAANRHGVNPQFMLRLAFYESGMNPNAVNYNTNGTRDLGLFQINDIHKISDQERFNPYFASEWTALKISAGGEGAWYAVKKVYAEGIYSNYK